MDKGNEEGCKGGKEEERQGQSYEEGNEKGAVGGKEAEKQGPG